MNTKYFYVKVALLLCWCACILTQTTTPISTLKVTTDSPATETPKTETQQPTTQPKETTTPAKPTGTTQPTNSTKRTCSMRVDCSDCTDDSGCYWCAPDKKCYKYETSKIIPRGCSGNKWYIGQCTIAGYILVIVVPSLAGLLLLCCGICIYCKCCRQSNKSWKKEEERITQRAKDRQAKHDERKSDRQKKSDALRMKYGLLKSDDEEPLI